MASRLELRSPVVLLALAVTCGLGFFAAPRPVRSRILPLPHVSFQQLRERDTLEGKRRAGGPLPLPLRRAGERFRRLGAALASQHGLLPVSFPYRIEGVQKASFELEREIEALRASGRSEELMQLRSLEADLFVLAARRFERSRAVDADLIELGGDFAMIAEESWFDGDRLVFTDLDLRLLFRVRFGRLTGTHEQGQFGPTKPELLYFHSLFLLHPPGRDPFSRASYRLGVVSAVEKLDPQYPAALTRALLLLDQAQPEAAARALFEAKRTGPWGRITENTLLAASALHPDP